MGDSKLDTGRLAGRDFKYSLSSLNFPEPIFTDVEIRNVFLIDSLMALS